jgi:pyruvate dehydrogenase E1 component
VSTYLRLSTRGVPQTAFDAALERTGADTLREQVLLGGYRLVEPDPELLADGVGTPHVVLAACGPIIPDVVEAAEELTSEGVAATVLNITSADKLFADWQSSRLSAIRSARVPAARSHVESLLCSPGERGAALVTVLDGSSHALAFLGSIFGQPTVPLGMDRFGQSGARADLYNYAGIDSGHIVNAALVALAR